MTDAEINRHKRGGVKREIGSAHVQVQLVAEQYGSRRVLRPASRIHSDTAGRQLYTTHTLTLESQPSCGTAVFIGSKRLYCKYSAGQKRSSRVRQ